MNPWQALNHDQILDIVEKTLSLKLSNLILKRNSYINRVYELEKYESRERIIAKFYRPGRWTMEMINEEHRFLSDLFNKEIPVVPPLTLNGKTLHLYNSIPFALFPKKGGRALDEFSKESWEELGRLIARMHTAGALKQSSRVTWKPSAATANHLKTLFEKDFLLPDFEKSFRAVAEAFINKAEPFFEDLEFILIHGDCHKGNLIHRPNEGIFIVDFDDLCFGPPVQDLWLFLPDIPEKCENELSWFLKGYELFRQFDRKSLRIIPLLRGMRIIHYASWMAVQSQDPDFKTHFPQAGTARYWNELIKELQEIVSINP